MFNYMFKPENGHIVGYGTRRRPVQFLLGKVEILEDVCFDLAPNDMLDVTVGRTHYDFRNVRREELRDKLEWFTQQKDEALKPYLRKRR